MDKKNCNFQQEFQVSAIELSESKEENTGIWKGNTFKPIAKLTGKMSEADIVNANGFLIPLSEWKDMLESNRERIQKGQCLMTLGHDERPYTDEDWRAGIIVGIIKDIWIEGKDVFFEVNICDNQNARDLMGIIGAGGYIQASTRLGIVPVKDEATGADCLIGKDSIIYGVDLVLDPAIESTWLEFRAASKNKTPEQISHTRQISQNLDSALKLVNTEIKYEQDFYNCIKGID